MKFKLAVLCWLASSSALADANDFIAGFNYAMSTSAEAYASFETLDDVTVGLNISTLGLYLGYINQKNNRFIVSYSSAAIDFNGSTSSEDVAGLDLDWQFVYGEELFQMYWGAGFGFHTIDEVLILKGTDLEGDSLNGLSFQLMAGIKAPFNERVEINVSIQTKAYAWQSIDIEAGSSTETIDTSYAQTALSIGAGYKF